MPLCPPTVCDPVELCKNNRGGIAGIPCHHSDIKWASQFNNISELKLAWGGETNSVVHVDVTHSQETRREKFCNLAYTL